MAKLNKDYFVVVDTREKMGYSFHEYDTCKGMIKRKLDTGDYSVEGLEDKVCIERKACVEEIANNIIDPSKRFDREIDRMGGYKHKYIICEFSMADIIDFPNNTGLPADIKKNTKITGKFLLKRLMEYQINHGVNVIFCGDKENAFYFVASLLKRLSEKYL